MLVQNRFRTAIALLALAVFVTALTSGPAAAQYKVTNLVSNQTGKALHQDTSLVNAWGIAFNPTGAFWVSDNATGLSTLYTGTGVKQSLVVTIPTASGQGTGSPTGMVYNASTDFQIHTWPSEFIFSTEDGTISGWSSFFPSAALIAVTNTGADYTGLAIGVNGGANFIYVADNANNRVDVYDKTFTLVNSFTDTSLPAGSNPYGIQNIGGRLYVTFTNGTGGGVVDIFTTAGVKVGTFASGGPLKSPWGVALAPANFGVMSNAILIGNLGNGHINAYNATTKQLIGPLKTSTGAVIVIQDLWGLAFGAGNPMNGKKNSLFFTAGPGGYINGLFGVINVN